MLGPDLLLFRSTLMLKPARHGSRHALHQDVAYWPLEPPTLVTVSIALSASDSENGCIQVIPGQPPVAGRRVGQHRPRRRRRDDRPQRRGCLGIARRATAGGECGAVPQQHRARVGTPPLGPPPPHRAVRVLPAARALRTLGPATAGAGVSSRSRLGGTQQLHVAGRVVPRMAPLPSRPRPLRRPKRRRRQAWSAPEPSPPASLQPWLATVRLGPGASTSYASVRERWGRFRSSPGQRPIGPHPAP